MEDLLIAMKTDISSLNNKVNSHADAIQTLEGQLSLLAAQLEPRMATKYDCRHLVVVTMVTHSIKIAIRDMELNEEN